MSRLKKVQIEDRKPIIQKTVRIPAELYDDFLEVMRDSGIDKFNFAIEKLIELEVEDWKREKRRLKKKRETERKESKNESKKE